MGIFQKKYDRIKDILRLEFDLETKKYVFYKTNEKILYESLNRKTKKYLDAKNQELINNPQLLEEKIKAFKDKLRFRKLESLGYSCTSFEHLGLVTGTMSNELKKYLTQLISEENILLGIHRVKPEVTYEQIIDILTNGLIITGHFGGARNTGKSLRQNVSYYPNNETIIKELMYADTYKNAIGSILVRIPDEDLTGNIFITDDDGFTRLNPKYILGFIPLENNHHIDKIIKFEKSKITDTTPNNHYFINPQIGVDTHINSNKKIH